MLALLLPLTIAGGFAGAVDRLGPDGGRGFLVADDAHTAPHLGVSALVLESFAKDPVVLRAPDGHIVSSVVPQQWTTTVAASVGLFDRLELSVRAAGALVGDKSGALTPALVAPRAALKAELLTLGPVALGARASVDAPVANGDVLSAEPALLASVDLPFLRAGVDAGPTLGLDGSMAVRFAAGAAVPIGDVFSVDADVYGSAAPGHTPLEGVLGADARLGAFDVVAGVGGGLVADVGTPRVRGFVAVRFALDPQEPAPPKPVVVVARAPAPTRPAPAPAPVTPKPVAAPAPVVPTVTVAEDHLQLDDDIVLFEIESDRLLPSAKAVLDEVARVLEEHKEIERVVIEGHADGTGDRDYNKRLSWWRALNVRRFLVDAGVDPARLAVQAYGMDKPRASNATEEGRRQNRRVEFTIERRAPLGHALKEVLP